MSASITRRRWLQGSALTAAALAWPRLPVRAAAASATHAADAAGFIKLDQNENPHGLSPKAEQAILAAVRSANRYPGRELAGLRDEIARREQVPAECVVLGAGCTEVFSLACLLWGAEGKPVLAAEPTYSGFVGYVQRLGGQLLQAPVGENWQVDLDALERCAGSGPSLVYVCNPNNPTGTSVAADRLRGFCERLAKQSVVLVDEAYYELMEESLRVSMVGLARAGAKVIVARTFSKLYGLAGLRVGYGIAPPGLAAQVRRVQTNFAPVAQLSLAAARAALGDEEFVAQSRQRNAEARAAFYAALDRLGLAAIPGSQTNFVTFDPKGAAERVAGRLQRDHRIGVRVFRFLGRSWIRASLGTPEEMARLVTALEQVV